MEQKKHMSCSPDAIEGEYRLIILGRKMYLTKIHKDGTSTKVKACCHKEDEWHMWSGIMTAAQKLAYKLKKEGRM